MGLISFENFDDFGVLFFVLDFPKTIHVSHVSRAWEENMISKDRSAPPLALDETSHDKTRGEGLC